MTDVRINRWLDFLDRVGWTAVQATGGAVLVALTESGVTWMSGLKMVGIAVGIAVAKVLIAQHRGSNDLGAAVPGDVIETGEQPRRRPRRHR